MDFLSSFRRPRVRRYAPKDRESLRVCFDEVFGSIGDFSLVEDDLLDLDAPNYVVAKGREIVGFYILRPSGIESRYRRMLGENATAKNAVLRDRLDRGFLRDLRDLGNGVEGVALGLKKAYRGQGLGRKLIDLPRTLGYHYVWGEQHFALSNIEHWLTRRRLVLKRQSYYVTAEVLS